jgi:GT2 family glycosyltransferase
MVAEGSGAPASTVVVVPREAHSPWRATLDAIADATRPPYRLVVVDGGSPPHVRRELERLAVVRDFTLIRRDVVVSANEARNLALAHVDTEFVVFLDNDTIVSTGWLELLEQCARDTGATAVVPVVLWGGPGERRVHCARGHAAIVGSGPTRRYDEHNEDIGKPADDVESLAPAPTTFAELHCLLVRTATLRELGPLDEELVAAREHSELILGIAQLGGTVWFEPRVVVRYPWPKSLRASDYPFYMVRWSDEWGTRSFARFNATWSIADTSDDAKFAQGHLLRRLGSAPVPASAARGPAWRAARHAWRVVDRVGTPVAVRVTDRRRARVAPGRVTHRASWDA